MGSLFSSPKKPKAPPLPPAPPPSPTEVDPSVISTRRSIRRRALAAGGSKSTIATSSQGLGSEGLFTAKKTLLGQ